jgi:hypothetical protein
MEVSLNICAVPRATLRQGIVRQPSPPHPFDESGRSLTWTAR